MPGRIIDFRDLQFVLWEHLELGSHLDHPLFQGLARADYDAILAGALAFAENEVYPVNAVADREGVRLVDGQVRVPPSFRPVYEKFCSDGWSMISTPQRWGGQGLPKIIEMAVGEMMAAASISFCFYPFHMAAVLVLEACASEVQKERYIPLLVTPGCSASMCLTEPQAGTAVGDIRTSARRRGDGTWEITGTKRFISSGDHDLADNVLHLVLARAEGSPPGVKGLSMFLVPKYRLEPDGSRGAWNHVACTKVEQKMGLHGSATCELQFGEGGSSVGELLGELDHGIQNMFVLMNEARIHTGGQGLALGSAAYLHALAYARGRIQGVPLDRARDPEAQRVPIIEHPDVRRMLLSMKSMVEGMRALAYKGQMLVLQASTTEEPERRQHCEEQLALLTPVIKAYCSDQGFLVTRDAIQVYGGYGYCADYPVEQYLRDCKVASLYEGANGIQALDLLGRKVLDAKRQMRPFQELVASMRSSLTARGASSPSRERIAKALRAVDTLDDLTRAIAARALAGDPWLVASSATDYLEAFGHTVVGHLLAEQLEIAQRRFDALCRERRCETPDARRELVEVSDEAAFYAGKVHAAGFFLDKVLPRVDALAAGILCDNPDVREIAERSF